MGDHKNTQFVRVYGAGTATVPELEAVSNLQKLDLNVFLDRINTLKDI